MTGSGVVQNGGRKAFLSHSSTDAELADGLCADLESDGVSCWIAPRDVTPGRPYAEECVRGIEESGAVVLLASAAAIGSNQVLSEIEQAHKRKIPIYTLLVGKPQIGRELDYYISRLHWLETGSMPLRDVASRLAAVISNRKAWDDVASPPSLRRTVLYRRDAFAGSAIATLLVLVLLGAGAIYWTNRSLDLDFRRLGYATLSPAPGTADDSMRLEARVWLLAEGARFADVRMATAAARSDGSIERSDRSRWPIPEQVGSQESVALALPRETTRLAVCLSMPSAGRGAPYRVTQQFTVHGADARSDQTTIAPIGDANVSKETGAPCIPSKAKP